MIIHILDRKFNTLTAMDNSLPNAMHYYDSEFHTYIESVSTLSFTVARNSPDIGHLIVGNYIQFEYKEVQYLMTFRVVDSDDYEISVEAESLTFDLLNEQVGDYKAPTARSLAEYMKDLLQDTDVVLGLNEVASKKIALEWTGDSSRIERIASVVNYFDAEYELITELNSDRSLKQLTLNVYKKYSVDGTNHGIGADRTDISLEVGKNIAGVRRTMDATELITAIKPTGADGLTIKDVEKTEYDALGNVQFYTKKGSDHIYAPMANALYGRNQSEKSGYIENSAYSYDTDNRNTLYGNALSFLKTHCEPATTYEVTGDNDLNIGDTVIIKDFNYYPELLLQARISEQIISFDDPSRNKTVYSNYKALQSQLSQSLIDRIDEVRDYVDQVAKTYIFSIKNTGSPMFKNGEGEVTLTAKIERNNQDLTAEFTEFNWIKQNKDGSLDTGWNAEHTGMGKSLTVVPSDFVDTATFTYQALQDGISIGGASGIVTNIKDGENGKTPVKGVDYFDGVDGTDGKTAYIHIRYSQSADGTGMTENPAGAVYVGLQTSQNPTASTVPADYMWSKIKGQDGIAGETGADGRTSYLHIKYSDDGGKTFTANTGETVGQWLGQYVDFESADSTDVSKYAWSKIKGDTGDDGQTPVVHPAWSWSADGTDRFCTEYPGENLFTMDMISPTPGSGASSPIISGNTATYPSGGWAAIFMSNAKVKELLKPDTVYSVQYIFELLSRAEGTKAHSQNAHGTLLLYSKLAEINLSDTKGNAADADTWVVGTQRLRKRTFKTPTNLYDDEANYRIIFYTMRSLNQDGTFNTNEKGKFYDIKFEESPSSTIYTPAPSEDYANAYPLYEGTYTDYSETASQNPADYTWRRIIGESGQDGVAGADGKGIKSTAVSYQASTSGTVAPTGTWVANPPAVTKGQYLWTRTIWTYTDNTTETGYAVAYMGTNGNDGSNGVAGKDGVGIKSTAITYAASTSGTIAPTTGWTTAVPTVAAGAFLWTKTVWTYTDSTTETGYSVAKMGEKGSDGKNGADGSDGKDGVGIASTAITYQASSDGTTAPTGPWLTTIPTVAANQYLWTRTVITYTNNTNSTAYSVGKMGANGTNGTNGKDGTDGKGIKSTAITYQAATSGTTVPTGTWAATIPTVSENQYLWTRTVITYTDSTTSTSYAIGKMGAQGPKGDNGQNGSDGKGIKSTAITYQASTSGTTVPTGTWVTSPPSVAANQYLWTRTVMTFTDNTTTTGYSIGKMGANGTNGKDGANGVSVSSVVEEYYISNSPTGQEGGSWSTTVPNNADPNLYVWRRMKTTLSNGNVSYTNPALIQGMTGIYPYIGPSQPANPKEGQQWWKSDASGNITDFLVYKSGSWQGQTIQQSILNIVSLNAVNITGSTITGTTINSSKFNTTFDFIPFPNGVKRKGTMQIANAETAINYTTYDSNSNVTLGTGNATYGGEGVMLNDVPAGDPEHAQYLALTPYGLTLNIGTVGGTLRYQDVVTYPKTGIPASSGFTQYSSSSSSGDFPSAQRIGRVVQLAGAFKNNSEIAANSGERVMGVLPVWARPATSINVLVQGTGHNIYLMVVNTNGNISFTRYRGGTSGGYDYKTCGAGSWLNIACVYAAADMPE